eukprot:gene9166-9333_t
MPPSAANDPNGLLRRPFPTSAWFTNVLWSPTGSPSPGQDPVQVFPYHLRVMGPPTPSTAGADRGLWFCKPYYTGDNDGGVIMATWPELQLTFKELQDAGSPAISALDWDDMGLTMTFAAGPAGTTGPSMITSMVKGSPYLTAQIPSPVKPMIRAPRAGNGGAMITSVSQVGPNKLKIVVRSVPVDGKNTWLLWASKPINFTASGSSSIAIWDPSTSSNEPQGSFAGTIRMAWVPNDGAPGAGATEAMLDSYVNVVTLGGSVKAWSNAAAQTASYAISWSTQVTSGLSPGSANQPLMLALPHHIDTMAQPATASSSAFPLGLAAPGSGATVTGSRLAYTSQPASNSGRQRSDYGGYIMSVRGPLVPVVGSCWVLQEQLVPLASEVDAAANLKDPAWRANIEQTLLADLPLMLPPASLGSNIFADWPFGPRSWPWRGSFNVDAYFGGSEMAAMARIIYIARALEKTAIAAGSTFGPQAAVAATRVTDALKQLLLKKLSLPCTYNVPSGAPNYGAMCYDTIFKLVTTSRAQSANDDGVDFFSRTGTDHHFHYGYWVAAAAAVAAEDAAWYQSNLATYINTLIRDYANNNKNDPLFPFARHKDWYMGHSWAAGLQASFDGKNQESSSEAVMAYSAIALLGRATSNSVMEGWGQLLLANEVTAARKYTQISGSAGNGVTRAKVATILFAAKASSYNWFDADILTRHAIQWIPFTPASNALLAPGWLAEAVPLVTAGTQKDTSSGPSLGWRVLLTMAQSMVPGQQAAAWNSLAALPMDADGGYALSGPIGRLTRTAAKWWIATRP